MLGNAIHPIHIDHNLAQCAEDIVLIVLIRLRANLDQAVKSIALHKLVHKLLVVLKDLFQREERTAKVTTLAIVQLFNTGVDTDR